MMNCCQTSSTIWMTADETNLDLVMDLFKNSLQNFQVFSVADIRAVHRGFDRRRLSEWQKKGYIIKIIKGYYIFSDVNIDEPMLWEIANKIYKPSYVSFENAMSHYRMIPESILGWLNYA
jgi:predicted transcriptional regulator of viral defense system